MKEFHETKRHGAPGFPFVVYPGNLPDYLTSYPLHWHEETELIYVVSGAGKVTVQAERFTVRTGDLVLITPQQVHSIEQLEDSRMVYFNVLFRLSMLGAEYTGLLHDRGRRFQSYIPRGTDLNEKLRGPVLELILNRKKTDTEYALMIRSHLYAIVYQILRHSGTEGESAAPKHTNYDRLKVVLEYLRDHYHRETTVEEAAAMCGFSPSHFMKLFRELTGSSFAQYVKNLRLDTAARLLRTTGKRVSDIAEEVGFHNLPYFTRSFAGRFRVSPLKYRADGASTGEMRDGVIE